MIKITKKKYLQGFLAVVIVLALVRCLFPSVAAERAAAEHVGEMMGLGDDAQSADSIRLSDDADGLKAHATRFFDDKGKEIKTRIYSVPGYSRCFPDSQHVHEVSAQQWGVKAVQDREEAESMKDELVYVGYSPYYKVDPLKSSIPYLVPRASLLLHDIGINFFDSLQRKNIPLHKMIVTSVLRTKDDVNRLRGRNFNATENSCHLYGTTFDICYNRYQTVASPGERRRAVRNDSLKYVLAEVLRDMREEGRCHVKYEVKQGCFHITVK